MLAVMFMILDFTVNIRLKGIKLGRTLRVKNNKKNYITTKSLILAQDER